MDKNPVDFLSEGQDQAFRTRIQNHLGSLKFTPEEMRQPMGIFFQRSESQNPIG